jgi:polyketide synthase PksN
MIDNEHLLELTQCYLKSLVCATVGSLNANFDPATPFGELGVDSFRVLKILKALEGDFGRLPKTLLFENFNIADLAGYFVCKHEQTLRTRFAVQLRDKTAPMAPAATKHERKATVEPIRARAAAKKAAVPEPLLITERAALADPVISKVVADIFARHKNEGSVSRGTRNIAPNLFIGSERSAYFNYSRSGDIVLAYAYTGPRDYFPTLAQELHAHCVANQQNLSILVDEALQRVGAVPYTATPFGALQRIVNLPGFTLDGKNMRRLRYQVSKFEKAGTCRTEEFRCGSDAQIARNIAAIIDQWCAARTMVNPLIHIVKEEIIAGTLNPEHRIFLTYVDDVLVNAILISPMTEKHTAYLMDLEFYPDTMPLGGLEFAIVNIVATLVAEGCDVLSLGGTYGCKLEPSTNADPKVEKILDDLRMQNIFNDEGNLQFKNKFRPENQSIFLCRAADHPNPDDVIDIIMMIADPLRMQAAQALEEQSAPASAAPASVALAPELPEAATQDSTMVIDGESRATMLAGCGFNPLNIPPAGVDFDLKTDSWAQLKMPAIESRRRHLNTQIHQPVELNAVLGGIFPFEHFALTTSGRTAESTFCRAWPRKGVVLQNLLFPTTIFHQIDKGFAPKELPRADLFEHESNRLDKGEMDLAALEREVRQDAAAIAYVCIEMSDNAAGGCPVSIAHLRQVKALLSKASIPLVLEGTRIVENALFLIENEAECAGKDVWEVVRLIAGYADAMTVSLAKDFCVNGGLIATNDQALIQSLRQFMQEDGCSLSTIDRKRVALSLQNRKFIEAQARRRKDSVLRIWKALRDQGIPLVTPAGAHCILVDVRKIDEFRNFKHPVASFLAWVYLNTGIRGGAHSAGMQRSSSLNELVRFAIPMGLTPEQVDEIIQRFVAAFADLRNIPEIAPAQDAVESFGDIHARYSLVEYHHVSAVAVEAKAPVLSPPPPAQPIPQLQPQTPPTASAASRDIAVIGMAGRYPKAKNLDELWENLASSKDCIEDIPDARLEQRLHNEFTRKYRGGFIADVDRFDARFFNISPKEAEVLDPQERQFLEVACEALEDAGYYPETLGRDDSSRDIGVFVGAVWSMYQMLGVEERVAGNNINPTSFFWSIANRVSYWMNLSGPSLTLDTACSASLTAIQLACESMHRGECSAAIVGGVNLDLHQAKIDLNAVGGSHSSDGHCRSFGKGANGYVSGEGVGALLLKPLDRAIADGDNIHGVIKSVAVTHSGKTSGYTIPAPHSHSKLVLKALRAADIDARSIGYIEAHGTGTDLGDSIEISGLSKAFAEYGAEKQTCAIGSVKTNVGHLEAASGVVGVQKVLLQMKHRMLVASLHSSELNENIDFANSPFSVPQKTCSWEPRVVDGVCYPRRAGVSAIGAGGTNAHIILEEYAAPAQPDADPASDIVFPLSAMTEEQLREAAARLRRFLGNAARCRATDVAHTLQRGRKSFDHRLVVVAKNLEELAARLDAFLQGACDGDVMRGSVTNAASITGLLNASEKQDFVDLLIRGGDARRIARLWADGVIADWRGIELAPGRRISLPTYPFAGERHWITGRKAASLPSLPPKAVEIARPRVHAAQGPAENARLFVRQLIANQLRVGIEQVDDSCQLMETGITSLDMAEMTQAIKASLDPAFSPTAFFECTTVRSLADLLAKAYSPDFKMLTVPATRTGFGKPLHVRDAESELASPDAQAIAHSQDLVSNTGARHVFLTGATGFLGIHVLAELLNADSRAQACCLVRAANEDQGLQRILKQARKFELEVDPARVRVLCGDISQPRLGLSTQDWDLCCRETQEIVHASARVNHIEGYVTFRDSTQGMKEVIRLAGSHRLKLIQFISSIAGCALKNGDEFSIFEKEAFVDDGAPVYGGYGQSKWVQETLLKRAHASGIPYVTYRFGELAGSARTGLGQIDDMLHRLVQMRLAIGCREKVSNDVLDMLPVDFAARLIVGTGTRPELWNAIVHATHSRPYSFVNLYRKLSKSGLDFTPVTRTQYLQKCHDFVRFIHSVNPVHAFVLECVLRDTEGSMKSRSMMDAYFAILFPFEQGNFKRALQTLELALPEWDSLIDTYLRRWSDADCGFMARIDAYRQWCQSVDAEAAMPALRVPGAPRNLLREMPREKSPGKPHESSGLLLGKVSEA